MAERPLKHSTEPAQGEGRQALVLGRARNVLPVVLQSRGGADGAQHRTSTGRGGWGWARQVQKPSYE